MTNMTPKTLFLLGGALLAGLMSHAWANGPSVALGRELFSDPALSGSGNAKSCNTCHPGGGDLYKAADKENLPAIINACVTGPLAGQPLNPNSIEMQSLVQYIQSLQQR